MRRSARFGEADVIEHLCAISGGRWDTAQIVAMAEQFLGSAHAVRLTPLSVGTDRRRPPQWSTAAHRTLEDDTLAVLGRLATRPARAVDEATVN